MRHSDEGRKRDAKYSDGVVGYDLMVYTRTLNDSYDL